MSEIQQKKPKSGEPSSLSAISIPGTITLSLYEDAKRYFVPPLQKIIMIVFVVVELLTTLYGIIFEKNWGNIIVLVLTTGAVYLLYRNAEKMHVKNASTSHPELKREGYKVVVTFAESIRLMNLTTGVERTLSYKEIYSVVDTEKSILCFAKKDKKRRYLLIPKSEMSEEQHDRVMEIITTKAGKLKKRW